MKSLFGSGGGGSGPLSEPLAGESTEPSTPVTKPSNLPAAAAAAITAANATAPPAASTADTYNAKAHIDGTTPRDNNDDHQNKHYHNNHPAAAHAALVEWDFGDAGDTPPPRAVPVKGAAGIERLDALHSSTVDFAGDYGGEGGGTGATGSPKSEDAVTPKARGGSSGMWAVELAVETPRAGANGGVLPTGAWEDENGSRRGRVSVVEGRRGRGPESSGSWSLSPRPEEPETQTMQKLRRCVACCCGCCYCVGF